MYVAKAPRRNLNKLLILFGISFCLRLWVSYVYWGTSSDEYFNALLIRETMESGFRVYPVLFMWFYYFVAGILNLFIQDAYLAGKLISVFFGSLSILIIYQVVKESFGRQTALLASVLLAIQVDFVLISSIAQRESTSAFFVFLSLYFGLKNKIVLSALACSFAFLTRFEAMFTVMPSVLVSSVMLAKSKKEGACNFLLVSLVFIGTFLFARMFFDPFRPLYETFLNHLSVFEKTGPPSSSVSFLWFLKNLLPGVASMTDLSGLIITIFKKALNGALREMQYCFYLAGPHLFFSVIAGIFLLIEKKISTQIKITLIFFIPHIFLMFAYIFKFEKLLLINSYRYFYVFIPFVVIFAAPFYMWVYQKWNSKLLFATFIAFVISLNVLVYFNTVWRIYGSTSDRNKGLVEAAHWIENAMRNKKEVTVFGDGVSFLYLERKRQKFDLMRIGDVGNRGVFKNTDTLMQYLEENNVEYVLWSGENWACRAFVPFLGFTRVFKTSSGVLSPIKHWNSGYNLCVLFKFDVGSDNVSK